MYYDATKASVREAVIILGHYLREKDRHSLDKLCKAYNELGPQQLNPQNESDANREIDKLDGIVVEHPKDIVKRHLQALCDFVS